MTLIPDSIGSLSAYSITSSASETRSSDGKFGAAQASQLLAKLVDPEARARPQKGVAAPVDLVDQGGAVRARLAPYLAGTGLLDLRNEAGAQIDQVPGKRLIATCIGLDDATIALPRSLSG
jgi:hypothetical protein